MGCLLSKNNQEITDKGKILNKKLSDEEEAPLPNFDELKNLTVGSDKYSDISQKKELAKFPLNNDIIIFKGQLDETMKIKNEDFMNYLKEINCYQKYFFIKDNNYS